jgi:hypothetical protein
MASIKRLPPEPPPIPVPRGRTRPSIRVDLSRYPAVAHRRAVNERLLARTCPFGPHDDVAFEPADLPVLELITAERFGGEHALLRHQAVVALGGLRSLDAVERLTALAISGPEHDSIRTAAVSALAALAPSVADGIVAALQQDPAHGVKQTAKRLTKERPCPGAAPARRRRKAKKRRTPGADRRR